MAEWYHCQWQTIANSFDNLLKLLRFLHHFSSRSVLNRIISSNVRTEQALVLYVSQLMESSFADNGRESRFLGAPLHYFLAGK